MDIIKEFYQSFYGNTRNAAFFIKGETHSYGDFLSFISGTQGLIKKYIDKSPVPIGIICYDNIETYAAIFATWFCGCTFVPINPKFPRLRNNHIIQKIGIKHILSTNDNIQELIDTSGITILNNNGERGSAECEVSELSPNQILYVLTTSGSTGHPKFVPINTKNVQAYCNGFLQLFPELKAEDNFLQTYDLTSDASLTGFLLPLLVGATVFTVPQDGIKFLSIAKLLSNTQVTWVKLTPSVLTYLAPYAEKLNLHHIKHVVFGGEALKTALLLKWEKVFRNADFTNLYGPTETTISATTYRFKSMAKAKSRDGVISIGKPFPAVDCVFIDDNNQLQQTGGEGILCIGGKQTMSGYLKQEDERHFFNYRQKKYYITGDIVARDNDGDYYFYCRKDDEIKIDGYRTNILEVEKLVSQLIQNHNFCVIAHDKIENIKRLYLFVENYNKNTDELLVKIKQELPSHMIPEEVFNVKKFPVSNAGKIDKTALKNVYLC